MTLTQAQIGALRALGISLLIFLLTWVGNAANISVFVSGPAATIISMLALSFEHWLSDGSATALFGTVTKA